MSVTQTDSASFAAVQTTDATVTDVIAAFSITDKSVTVLRLKARAVRNNAANPLVYYTERLYTVTRVAGNSSITGNTTICEHGDSSMEVAVVVVGGSANVKVQVTGIAATTFDWRVSLAIEELLSN